MNRNPNAMHIVRRNTELKILEFVFRDCAESEITYVVRDGFKRVEGIPVFGWGIVVFDDVVFEFELEGGVLTGGGGTGVGGSGGGTTVVGGIVLLVMTLVVF